MPFAAFVEHKDVTTGLFQFSFLCIRDLFWDFCELLIGMDRVEINSKLCHLNQVCFKPLMNTLFEY